MQKPLVDPGARHARQPAVRPAPRGLRPQGAGETAAPSSGWSKDSHTANGGKPAAAGPVSVCFCADGKIAIGSGGSGTPFASHRESFAIVEPRALGEHVLQALDGSAGAPRRLGPPLDEIFRIQVSRDASHIILRSISHQMSHAVLLSPHIHGSDLGMAILQFADDDPIDLENVEYLRSEL